MGEIYLASNSKARKKILKDFGLKFKVLSSRTKEISSKGKLSYVGLAKKNALLKAQDVAQRIKRGLVIAADTLIVQDNKIFGKPKNLADARRMLKKLSAKPQWLYTGICAISKGRGKNKDKILLDYEKTKIYMDKLSSREISGYFKKVSPLDKAGSFDIQGRGAFFIRRIEGCYYNVVGLPVRKLYLMLKKFGIRIFVFLLLTILSGCSTEYNIVTGEQEVYYYSTDKEVQMGKALNKQVHEQFKLADDPLLQKRVEDIGKKIVAVCDRKDIDYHFYVLNEEDVNAFSLPGGYVYIFKGLIEKTGNDDSELAGVIGHEVGHIVARHSIKRLQAEQLYSVLRVLTAVTPNTADAGVAADIAVTQLMLGYSREDEFLADKLGTKYLKLAGYDPNGMIRFLIKLRQYEKKQPLRQISYYKTHPYVPDRIRAVKMELGEGMGFDDYINIENQPHK
ncbi:MAG: Maf family nucleotide pyrophosphatase [Candidatus Omnitrophota bacterium]|jgi:MAF protein